MRAVIQRVTEAAVRIDGEVVGQIGKGFLVLIGVECGDTEADLRYIADKTANLRVFEDAEDKMNLSVKDVDGEILCVSQFTLCADLKKGNRPSFSKSGDPQKANELYEYIIELCRKEVSKVEHGEFGADMKVALVNDGPFTIYLDSKEIIKA